MELGRLFLRTGHVRERDDDAIAEAQRGAPISDEQVDGGVGMTSDLLDGTYDAG